MNDTDSLQGRKLVDTDHVKEPQLRQLLELYERDRQLIGFNIHDGVAQHVEGALMHLQACELVRETAPDVAQQAWKAGLELLGRAVTEIRQLIHGLRPPNLDEIGLVGAVEHLVRQCRSSDGPAIEFSHRLRADHLAPPLENAVYRIVQESLTNACRHSRSERIRVELAQRDQCVEIEVRDWGSGFRPEEDHGHGFGLRGIRQRAELLGGRAVIKSAPGQGTQITAHLPLVSAG